MERGAAGIELNVRLARFLGGMVRNTWPRHVYIWGQVVDSTAERASE